MHGDTQPGAHRVITAVAPLPAALAALAMWLREGMPAARGSPEDGGQAKSCLLSLQLPQARRTGQDKALGLSAWQCPGTAEGPFDMLHPE